MKKYLLIPFCLILSSCSTPEGPYVPDGESPGKEVENTAVILDREISKKIAVDTQKADRTSQGKLKGRANIRNRTNQDLPIQVQTVFRDEEGFSIDDETSWETLILTANETRSYSATSTTKKADRYTVRIRMTR